ncbi:ATP-binding SpoIIE family protein phosphatase [Variovorax paradoxus]|jgi:anti-sigma regulatory factor (Ser/Thr protein kinase)|uniref:Serine/threonine-protein kinase RsbT n=1 Tax=Variovorax paradoxus TaxID=34073 RepID=A0A679JSW6_VARPD|nr:Serine/threonine-protein kinase RsbT [Variovorax paradoxus]
MTTFTGWTHKAFAMDDASRVGEARRHAAQAVAEMGWSEVDAGRLALVVTELGTNLQRHARGGRLLIAVRPQSSEVEVLSIDDGPGIPDLALAMQDGHSSGSTPGTGLGAVRRLADDFDVHSSMPDGTVGVARVRAKNAAAQPASIFQVGAVCLPAPHESVSGDGWAYAFHGDLATVLLADGLGHGPDAAKAADAAIGAFVRAPEDDVRETVQRVHRELQTTRGAAVCALRIDAAGATVSYSGAGNIVGRVVSGVFDKSIITQHGTAGMQIRKPESASLEWPDHALVVLHSDGIETRWTLDRIRPLLQRDPTLVAAVLLRDHTRHRDDATVVVIRRKE